MKSDSILLESKVKLKEKSMGVKQQKQQQPETHSNRCTLGLQSCLAGRQINSNSVSSSDLTMNLHHYRKPTKCIFHSNIDFSPLASMSHSLALWMLSSSNFHFNALNVAWKSCTHMPTIQMQTLTSTLVLVDAATEAAATGSSLIPDSYFIHLFERKKKSFPKNEVKFILLSYPSSIKTRTPAIISTC